MLIHGSELVAVAQGLVEYRDSRWIFSALRQDLKNPSTTVDAESPCAASSDGGGGRGRGRTMTKVFLRFLPHDNRLHPVQLYYSELYSYMCFPFLLLYGFYRRTQVELISPSTRSDNVTAHALRRWSLYVIHGNANDTRLTTRSSSCV